VIANPELALVAPMKEAKAAADPAVVVAIKLI